MNLKSFVIGGLLHISSVLLCLGYCSPRIDYLDKEPWIGIKLEFPVQIIESLKKQLEGFRRYGLTQEDLFNEKFKILFTTELAKISKEDWDNIIETLLTCNEHNLILPYYGRAFNFLGILKRLKSSNGLDNCGLGYVITDLDEYIQYSEEKIKSMQYELEEANLLQ